MNIKRFAATGLLAGGIGLMPIGLDISTAFADPQPSPHPGPITHAVVPDQPSPNNHHDYGPWQGGPGWDKRGPGGPGWDESERPDRGIQPVGPNG